MSINWGSEPQALLCPYCDSLIITHVVTRSNVCSHIAAIALCISNAFHSQDHYCPICKSLLATNNLSVNA